MNEWKETLRNETLATVLSPELLLAGALLLLSQKEHLEAELPLHLKEKIQIKWLWSELLRTTGAHELISLRSRH